MNRRAREVLTSIAAAGIGGAIGTLVGRKRPSSSARRRHARPARDVDVVPADLAPDPGVPEAVFEAMETNPSYYEDVEIVIVEGPMILDDDRDDGENWIESMLEGTSNDLPADRPLIIEDQPRRRH
jgi:hypothetical protein